MKLTNTNETHPALFTMYKGKGRAAGVQLGNHENIWYRVWHCPSFCRMRTILYQSPPARKILMYVLFAFTFHIPVHTAVLTHMQQRRGGIFLGSRQQQVVLEDTHDLRCNIPRH